MHQKLSVLIILVFSLSLFGCQNASLTGKSFAAQYNSAIPVAAFDNNFGKLTIETNPGEAKIIIDGITLDITTPLYNFSVPLGHHTLELVSNEQYGSYYNEIDILSGQTTRIYYEFKENS